MPKTISTPSQNSKSLIFTTFFLFCFNLFFAQNNLAISYGDKIDLSHIDNSTSFYIKGNNVAAHLKGNEINDYVFEKPGVYLIKVTEKKADKKADACRDIHLPKEITVNVSRIKMTFDPLNISFSAPITKNKETRGTTLTIPATIKTFDHLPAALNFTQVNTAGIGTNIIADLQSDEKQLSEGTHTLNYSLSGIVAENSYLMFDFIDANAKIQSVSLATAVKN